MSDVRQQVQQAIDQLVESGAERGLQVAVYRHGEQVVDAVAGVADPATGRPVASDTVFYNRHPARHHGRGPVRLGQDVRRHRRRRAEVFGMPTTWGLGYGIGGPGGDAQDAPTVFGLGGVGGSFACGDTASGIAWAVTKNRVSNDFSTSTRLGQLITGAL